MKLHPTVAVARAVRQSDAAEAVKSAPQFGGCSRFLLRRVVVA